MAMTVRIVEVEERDRETRLIGDSGKGLSLARTVRGYMYQEDKGWLFQYEARRVKSARWLMESAPQIGLNLGLCNEGDRALFDYWLKAMVADGERRLEMLGDLMKRAQSLGSTSKVDIPDCWIAQRLGTIRSVVDLPGPVYLEMANDFFRAGKKDVTEFFEGALTAQAWRNWREGLENEKGVLAYPFEKDHEALAKKKHRGKIRDEARFSSIVEKYCRAGAEEALQAIRNLSRLVQGKPKKG